MKLLETRNRSEPCTFVNAARFKVNSSPLGSSQQLLYPLRVVMNEGEARGPLHSARELSAPLAELIMQLFSALAKG